MKQKILASLMAAAMLLSLAACGGNGAAQVSSPSTAGTSGSASSGSQAPTGSGSQAPAGTTDQTFTIGICQLAPHPALDAAFHWGLNWVAGRK